MTTITIVNGDRLLDIKTFSYRFQARTWLLLNGYLFDGHNLRVFDHINNGNIAQLNSRGY